MDDNDRFVSGQSCASLWRIGLYCQLAITDKIWSLIRMRMSTFTCLEDASRSSPGERESDAGHGVRTEGSKVRGFSDSNVVLWRVMRNSHGRRIEENGNFHVKWDLCRVARAKGEKSVIEIRLEAGKQQQWRQWQSTLSVDLSDMSGKWTPY